MRTVFTRFFQGAIMPSVANLPAAVFDVRYAPNSDQILRRSEMTRCANSEHMVSQEIAARPASQHDRRISATLIWVKLTLSPRAIES